MVRLDGAPTGQRGLVLLIVVIGIILVALGFIANGLTSKSLRMQRQNDTAIALAKAKEALKSI